MISSGIGSFISEFFKKPYNAIKVGLLGILFSIAISYIFSKYFTDPVIELEFWKRVLIISLLTSLSGIFLGFMMSSGIRAVSAVENSIPWVWLINGVFSVVASFVAIYVSILSGFTVVLIISAVVYTLGTLVFCFKLTAI